MFSDDKCMDWNKFNIKRSLGAKIVFRTAVAVMCVFFASFGTALWLASQKVDEAANFKANVGLDNAIRFVDHQLDEIEVAAENISAYFGGLPRIDDDDLYEMLAGTLAHNTYIQGIVLAYEPDIFPDHAEGFAPYVMVRDGKATKLDLAVKRPSYRELDWYRPVKENGKAIWSKVFFETNGTLVMSYSAPLINKDKGFVGIVVLDLALDTIHGLVSQIHPFEHSYLSLLDNELRFIVHPNQNYVLKETAPHLLGEEGLNMEGTMLDDLVDRKRGMGRYDGPDGLTRVYYAPTNKAGMSMTMSVLDDDISYELRLMRTHMIALTVLGMLIILLVCEHVIRGQVRVVQHFIDAAKSIASGNFHTLIPDAKDKNELHQLGRALDDMQHSLENYVTDLKQTMAAKGKIENELHIASQIQKSMLPKIYPPYPDRDDVDIYGTLIPAKEVGGDLFDFFIRDEKLFFCIGDVSGKGIPASLVMAVTRSLIRMVSVRESRPVNIVSSLNNSMADMNDTSMFVTLFVGVLDLPTGRLRYCNAGHNAPLIARGDDGGVEMISVVPNLPVAVLPDMKFEEQEMVLPEGSTLFLYTDGLTEAEDMDKKLFGDERMMEQMKTMADDNARAQVDKMVQAVQQHAGGAEQSDDLTMLSIRFMGQHVNVRFTKHIQLMNQVDEIPRLESFIEEIGEELGLDMPTVMNINLAIEEAVTNVVLYAYAPGAHGTLTVDAVATDDYLKLVITDAGVPFDPTQKKDPDITLGVEERQIGGLGIMLVRKIMDSVNYERIGGHNVLTVRKYIHKVRN